MSGSKIEFSSYVKLQHNEYTPFYGIEKYLFVMKWRWYFTLYRESYIAYIQMVKIRKKAYFEIQNLNCRVDKILVTMDVASLYTNIDHNEGANACYTMLEKRKNKKIPLTLLKRLILLVLKSNIFRSNEQLYRQVKGTAMGTPMAVNYANIFLDRFENDMLAEYERRTNLRQFLWMRYIDDVVFFYIDETSLKQFIKFCDNYNDEKKMKSKIKFESNISKESVNFFDVTVKISGNIIKISLFSKPTDAHLYLHSKSSHPHHVVKNIPKGQFIRVRRICSDVGDYDLHAKTMKKNFISRGYEEKHLCRTIEEVRKMIRKELFSDKSELPSKDAHTVLVCTWHPSLKHNILSADIKFKERSTVAFRRKKNLSNHLCRNDIRKKQIKKVEKCKGCQLCKIVNSNKTVVNKNNGVKVDIKQGANCKTTGIIYAINCKTCEQIYMGHTGNSMSEWWSKHKYDVKNRPTQNELATHCHKDHDLEKDIEVFILDHGIHSLEERKHLEDKYICKLQTLQSNDRGMNRETGPYAKEMYQLWTTALKSKPSMDHIHTKI